MSEETIRAIVLAGSEDRDLTGLEEYRAVGGYGALSRARGMEAQAVLDRSGVGEAAVRSVAAGGDLLLLTGSGSWNEVFPRLLRRARRDGAFRERVEEAADRVLRLKRALGLRTGR